MRGPSYSPFGWAALALVVVAYAHVILQIAVALLAIAVAARVIMSPVPGLLVAHLARQLQSWQVRRRLAARRAVLHRRTIAAAADRPEEAER